MREELLGPKVENVGLAILEDLGEDNIPIYNAYIFSERDDIMEGIIITSTGYGENAATGERVKTSTLRHCLEILLPGEAAKIEPIVEEVFGLTNEYWVSFWVNDVMYDKKYIFLAETIQPKNMRMLNNLNKKGLLIM
jgi:hypothetical protein